MHDLSLIMSIVAFTVSLTLNPLTLVPGASGLIMTYLLLRGAQYVRWFWSFWKIATVGMSNADAMCTKLVFGEIIAFKKLVRAAASNIFVVPFSRMTLSSLA